jgi:hypothetical protein
MRVMSSCPPQVMATLRGMQQSLNEHNAKLDRMLSMLEKARLPPLPLHTHCKRPTC